TSRAQPPPADPVAPSCPNPSSQQRPKLGHVAETRSRCGRWADSFIRRTRLFISTQARVDSRHDSGSPIPLERPRSAVSNRGELPEVGLTEKSVSVLGRLSEIDVSWRRTLYLESRSSFRFRLPWPLRQARAHVEVHMPQDLILFLAANPS